jgi:transcriptional regulator with XRE-family HTH domain
MICVRGLDFPMPPIYAGQMGGNLGEKIRKIRVSMALEQDQFAEKLGTTQSTVSRWERGSKPGAEYLRKIADIANTTVDRLLGIDDLAGAPANHIPVVGYVGAGAAIIPYDDYAKGDAMDYVERPAFITGQAVAVEVRGDSLWPVAEDGWRLVYTGQQAILEEEVLNRLCVVQLTDGRMLVKRVVKGSMPQRYHLISTNAPIIEDVEIQWAARVKAIIPD